MGQDGFFTSDVIADIAVWALVAGTISGIVAHYLSRLISGRSRADAKRALPILLCLGLVTLAWLVTIPTLCPWGDQVAYFFGLAAGILMIPAGFVVALAALLALRAIGRRSGG